MEQLSEKIAALIFYPPILSLDNINLYHPLDNINLYHSIQ